MILQTRPVAHGPVILTTSTKSVQLHVLSGLPDLLEDTCVLSFFKVLLVGPCGIFSWQSCSVDDASPRMIHYPGNDAKGLTHHVCPITLRSRRITPFSVFLCFLFSCRRSSPEFSEMFLARAVWESPVPWR